MKQSPITFPGSYRLLHTSIDPNVSLVCGFDRDEIETQIVDKSGYGFIEITFGGRPIFIALREFEIPSSPKRSMSSGSEAIYPASRTEGMATLLLQHLPPFSTTSTHYHKETNEVFHSLSGNATLHVRGGDRLSLTEGVSVLIEPNTTHWLETHGSDSLILIEMISERDEPGMSDHFYVDR